MEQRTQAIIGTEVIKTCTLLLQLLREEFPEFDLVAYLRELSLKYNR